jgi:programmed cell death protein 5
MEELEELRKRKLAMLQQQVQQQQEEQLNAEQQIAALESLVKPRLTKDAASRFGNLKAGQPQTALQLLVILGQLIQAGKLAAVDDKILVEILKEIQPRKKEIKIIRK